jgi:DNA-binding NtrC family response regulator
MTEPQAHIDERQVISLSIVALDDDADFRDFLRSTLDGEGHSVRLAATPDELFRQIQEHMPDVVLVDMKMGPYQGEQVVSDLRTRWPKLCIIVITGYPSMDSMRRTFKQDVFDYLAKPFAMDELRACLAQATHTLGLGMRPQDRLRRELGRLVRMARTDRQWTLKELSEAAGLSISQLSSIERGTHLPSLESLLQIADALDAKPSQWLSSAGL